MSDLKASCKLIVRNPNGSERLIGYFFEDDLRMQHIRRGDQHKSPVATIIEIEGTVYPPELIQVDKADLEWLRDDLAIRRENIEALEEGHLDPALSILNKIMKGVSV